MGLAHGRVLLHLAGRRRRVVEAEDIYYLALNPAHVREIRPAGSGWEVRLEPPVNKVLPVSRRLVSALFDAYRVSG